MVQSHLHIHVREKPYQQSNVKHYQCKFYEKQFTHSSLKDHMGKHPFSAILIAYSRLNCSVMITIISVRVMYAKILPNIQL